MKNFYKKAVDFHKGGKISIQAKPLKNKADLSLAYTPGVGLISAIIARQPEKAGQYTSKPRTVAIVSDGSAVLGLGNIGPLAALPVMEGKSMLFKYFGKTDAVPLCIDVHDAKGIADLVKAIAPSFGAVNLEDIAAPVCFEVEERLKGLKIPFMHDDQHGTAIVVAAALLNAAKVAGKKMNDLRVVICGAGAAGTAIAGMLGQKNKEKRLRVADILVVDTHGIIYRGRKGMNKYKKALAGVTNKANRSGDLLAAMSGADVFIGVSKAGLLKAEFIKKMAKDPIIFALANPVPEIMPQAAYRAGACVVATGRSDFENQVNNALAFPGVFKGVLEGGFLSITQEMKNAAVFAIADVIKRPSRENIIPPIFDKRVVPAVVKAVKKAGNK
jgi:malate dehydrogenase (oxaloacetate-decarboxylating)